MAILKCKMCGGDILLSEDKTTGTCDHCGSTMTFPRVSDEQKLNLYNRANHFRRQNEFDKAITAYERILDQDDTDAEAHWGAVLSRYGIEYVEDPVTHERIPTCHRVQLSSILSDGDYLAALENAPDTASRDLYEQEAHRIAEIQKGILSISSQEKPYDVFICYKETDDFGSRTKDSTLAQEIYYQLTNEGYKVFFSRITLEDKLGQQYEPYIFAALNSAKVMLVIGTKPEYFSAVWVKNEWSRYLALMKNDRSRLLIPCYRDMDPYDLPEELSALQSQDMSKIGFVQDLIRGVKKVLDSKKPAETKPATPQVTATGANIENLMKRARLFMEDGDFASANEYLDKVLDEDAEYAPAYAGKVCIALGFRNESDLAEATFLYADHPDWKKALRFATPQQKAVYDAYYEKVKERVTDQIVVWAYDCAVEMAVNPNANQTELERELNQYKASCASFGPNRADGKLRKGSKHNEEIFLKAINDNDPGTIPEENYIAAAEMLRVIDDEEAASRAENCIALAEQARKKAIYDKAVRLSLKSSCASDWEELATLFMTIPDYKDAREKAETYHEQAESIRKDLYDAAIKAMNEAETDGWNLKWKQTRDKLNHSDLDEYRDIPTLRRKAEQRYRQYAEAEEKTKRQEAARAKARKNRIAIFIIAFIILAVSVYVAAAREAKLSPYKTIGNCVTLGTYPETYWGTDNTAIYWLVLDYDAANNRALLISRYGLDAQPFNKKFENTTWEKCTLRTWLNSTFFNEAFSAKEQSAILLTSVDNSSSQGYSGWSTSSGNNTQDKIFLLSYAEANKYFNVTYSDSNTKSRVHPTAYARQHGAKESSGFETADGTAAGMWWLRSPGSNQGSAAYVDYDGSLDDWSYVGSDSVAVRPAFWLNLNANFF